MLSMSNVSGGAADSGYYKSEGYYIQGSPEADAAAQYIGKAAEAAGLSGRIDDAKFSDLLDGNAPNGQRIGRMRDGEWEHRPALDLTFSAPKSVSIAALVGDDATVRSAHDAAVKEAVSYVEDHVAQTRKANNGVMEKVNGGKLIVGAFQHDTSRALDPHLHTHAVIANMVLGDDGRYRALHNDEIYKQTLVIGQVYRNALANKLEAAGYDVEWDRKTGLFEITNVPKGLVELFSTRRQEIEASLNERGLEHTTRNSQLAALATRSTKAPIERADLYQAWRSEVEKSGLAYRQPERAAQAQDQPASGESSSAQKKTPEDRLGDVKAAVSFSIEHLSERNSAYALKETVLTAMRHDTHLSPVAIDKELGSRVERGELYVLSSKGETLLTDERTVQLERENVAMMKEAQGQSTIDVRNLREKLIRRTPEGTISERLARSTLTEGQKEAVSVMLTSPDKIVGVQGLAGTGKSYMVGVARGMLEKAGYQVEGLGPSHNAVRQLEESVPNSRTVSSVLTRHAALPKEGDKSNTYLVIDEASMISSAQMNDLLRMIKDKNYAGVALLGDAKQLDAVGAGPSFRQLQEHGLHTAQMLDIQRQNTLEGRTAVLHAASGNVREAFEGLAHVHTTNDGKLAIAERTSEIYLARTGEDRINTAIVVMTNEMRGYVNSSIQSGLREQGVLKGSPYQIDLLESRKFTVAEASEVRSYTKDDILMVTKPIIGAGMEPGGLYKVTGIDEEKRTLELVSDQGVVSNLPLNSQSRTGSKLAVYREREEKFYVGDQIKFKITDKDNGIFNANFGRVSTVTETHISVIDQDDKRQTLKLDSLAVKGMELAYSSTAHGFQGATEDRVLLAMEATEQLATQKAFYVGLSRMRNDTELVTNDVDKLMNTIQANTGERVTALGLIAEQTAQNPPQQHAQTDPQKSGPDKSVTPSQAEQNDDGLGAQKRPEDTSKNERENQSSEREKDTSDRDQKPPSDQDQTQEKKEDDLAVTKSFEELLAEAKAIGKENDFMQQIKELQRGERER